MKKILQCNPHASYLAQKKDIDQAIKRVLDSGWYILGEECEAFEREFAEYIGVKYAVGVATGTDALFLALKACGINAGDEVITVSHTAVATVAAIVMSGAVPVFVDIDPVTYTMNTYRLKDAVTSKTKAIVPVHLYGMPADMPTIMAFAHEHGLKVIEDCAQAHGARIKVKSEKGKGEKAEDGGRKSEVGGRSQGVNESRSHGPEDSSMVDWQKVGTFGDAAAFSFYPTKNLGTFGDGGCVVTDNPKIAEELRSYRQYGWKERYISSSHGWNSRLDEMHAAILRVKLSKLDENNDARRRIAKIYDDMLEQSNIIIPRVPETYKHVYHQYVVQYINRDDMKAQLAEKGIGTAIHYPLPVHLQPTYCGYHEGNLPDTEILCGAILSLPMYPQMSDEDAERVGAALLQVR